MTTRLMVGISMADLRGEARHQTAARYYINVLTGPSNGLGTTFDRVPAKGGHNGRVPSELL